METYHDNRLRNRNIEFHLHSPDLPITASGTRFFQTILDPAVGREVVLVLVDQTDFAYKLARRSPFELRVKTGAVRTSFGPMVFLLWWVPPISERMPFALYEHLLNPTDQGAFEMVRKLSLQTHLHVLLIGPGQEVLDCFEFENTFQCGEMLPLISSALTGPPLDFEAAKQQYEQKYDLETLFALEQAEPVEEHNEGRNVDGDEDRDTSAFGNAIDWKSVEPIANSAFNVWIGQPELAWAKKAFRVLAIAGLLDETNTFSQHLALFRILVLGGIYRDFCDAAWDETSSIDYAEWCVPDGVVDRFIVGQLFARMPDWRAEDEVEFAVALERIVEDERETVVKALRKGFGGIAGLYASMWEIRENADDSDDEFEDDDSFDADDSGKLKAYEWVSEGCPRLADPAE